MWRAGRHSVQHISRDLPPTCPWLTWSVALQTTPVRLALPMEVPCYTLFKVNPEASQGRIQRSHLHPQHNLHLHAPLGPICCCLAINMKCDLGNTVVIQAQSHLINRFSPLWEDNSLPHVCKYAWTMHECICVDFYIYICHICMFMYSYNKHISTIYESLDQLQNS